jgi:hypothetical protein
MTTPNAANNANRLQDNLNTEFIGAPLCFTDPNQNGTQPPVARRTFLPMRRASFDLVSSALGSANHGRFTGV